LLNEFYEKANRLQQQFQAIQDLTNLSADEAQKLLNQFEDAPHELLRELLLASDYDPDLVAYAEQFADLEHRFGTALVSQGKWYEGLRRLERGLTIRRLLDDLDARADTIYQIGRVYHLMSDLAEAQIRYRDALRLYEHTKNEEGIAICNLNLGNLAIQLGYIDEGITKIELAKDFYRKTKNYNRLHEIEEIVNLVTHIREKEMA
jgi:tetratricopeptide (TPR) repeat protein